jgi:hypothetical protein
MPPTVVLQCGCDRGNPVAEAYASPFAFTGTIESVIVEVEGRAIRNSRCASIWPASGQNLLVIG